MAREYTAEELGLGAAPAQREYTAEELGISSGQREFTAEELGITKGAAEPKPDALGRYIAEPQQEEKTSNPFKGLAARAAQLAGEGIEGVARAAENIGDKLELAMPLTNLTPEQVKAEQQLQPLFDFSKNLKDWGKDIGYAPSTQLGELPGKPLLVVPFIAERVISSSPDMVAAVGAAPAYIVSRTNEILNDRLTNDKKPLEEATVADVSAAAGAAVLETFLERFATKHLLPGGGSFTGSSAKKIGKETALQSGTESVEEGIGYLGGAAGTESGVDPYQMAQQMIEGAIVGGGLGAGVQGTKEYLGRKKEVEEAPSGEKRRTAFDEVNEYDDTGRPIAGAGEQSISVPSEPGDGSTTGADEGASAGVAGTERTARRPDVGEEEFNNQLGELRAKQDQYARFDPADPRINEIEDVITELRADRKATAMNAPGARPEFTKVGDAIVYEKGAFIKGDSKDDLMKASANFTEIVPSNGLYEKFYEDFPQFPKGSMDGAVFVHGINVNGKRGTGLGKQILDATTKWADQKGKAIFLVPAAQPDAALGGLTQEQLKEWYVRNGFEDHVDYMLRRPQKAQALNAPSQEGFDFTEPDENTQRTLSTGPAEFGLTAPEGEAPAAKPIQPIEPIVEPERAKMMLIGDAKAPMKPLTAFFNSLKPSTVMPAEVTKFKEETRKLLDDVAEFIGGKITKQVSRFEGTEKGPDVSAELAGPELDARLKYVRDFFDSLSIAPKEREALTSALSQRFAGMSMAEQTAALQGLTSVPKLNTRRGIEELREKLSQALDKYERKRIGQEETAIPFKVTDDLAKKNMYVVALIRKALNALENTDPSKRTPEEKAAYAYFGNETGWNYVTAMRSAAFDIGSKADEFAGKLFKGQDKTQAELFQKWVEENLPQKEYEQFQATVADYKRQIIKAEEYRKTAEKLKKEGGVARKYFQSVARAPSGKVSMGEAAWGKGPGKASKVEKFKYYPMHPAVQKMLEEGNVKGALKILAKQETRNSSPYARFTAHLAQKLIDMNLNTTVLINQQDRLVDSLLTYNISEQRSQFFSYIKDKHPLVFEEYFSRSDPRQVLKGLQAIKNGDVSVKTDPVIGQFDELLDEYQRAVGTLDSSGTYLPYIDTINLNFDMGGSGDYTFMHEMVHAGTAYALNPANYNKLTSAQQKAVTELTALYEFAKRSTLKEYGFINLDEFVAEALSNPTFQDVLRDLNYKGETISLWDKFTEFVSKLFGLDNVLGYTLANVNVILEAPAAVGGEAVAMNAKGQSMRSALNKTMPTNPGFIKFLDRTFGGRPEWHTLKYNMSHLIESIQDSTRKYYLGGFTLRQLNDMIGSRVPQFRKFIDTMEVMLDERNKLLVRGEQIGRRFLNLKEKHPEQYAKVSELMVDVTRDDRSAVRFNKDPAKGDTGVKHIDDAWKSLNDEAKAVYRQVRDFYIDSRREYIDITLDDLKKSLLNQGYKETDIAAQKYINQNFGIPIKALKARGKTENISSETIDNSIAAFLKSKGYTDTEIEAYNTIQNVEDYFAAHEVDVYFPLYRKGEFSLQIGRSDTDREYYLFETAGERNFFQQQRLKEFKDKGIKIDPNDVIPRNSKEDFMGAGLQEFEFFDKLKKMIDAGQGSNAAELKKNLTDNVEQLQFLLLPDKNLRKRFVHRKGIAGMETDMAQAFTNSSFHLAYQLARKKHSRSLYNLTATAADNIKDKGEEGKVEFDYLQELNKRLVTIMNPVDSGGIPSFLSNLSFIWYMTAPASAIVNMLGVPAVSFPVMGARFGGVASAAKLGEYMKTFAKAGYRDANKKVTFPSINNNLDLLQDTKGGASAAMKKRAFQQLGTDGLFDITLPHSLVDLAEKPSNASTGKMEKVMKVVSAPFHAAEKFNREVVGMATFDLAFKQSKEKGFSDENAFKQAIKVTKDLTYKSMGDYATLNKPRYFQHPLLKVILQFKLFSQNMTYMLGRSVMEAAHAEYSENERHDIGQQINGDLILDGRKPLIGKDLEEAVDQYIKDVRKEAFNRLGGTLGMTAIFAGASGLPLWSVVAGTMNMLHAAFGDDDDETYDFDNWFKNWCNNTFGGFVGDSISRGVVSQVLGADVASRLSLNDMWYRDARKSPDEITQFQNILVQLLGPTASLGVSMADAYGKFKDGHIERSLEAATPAVIKNAMKSVRLANEGATTLRGNKLVGDITATEVFGQALGFSPERVAQRQKANIEMKTAEQAILNRRQALLDAHFMSYDTADSDMRQRVVEKVHKFNAANPQKRITLDNLQDSVKTRMKQRALANMTGGMSIDKKLIGKLHHMGEYGNPE